MSQKMKHLRAAVVLPDHRIKYVRLKTSKKIGSPTTSNQTPPDDGPVPGAVWLQPAVRRQLVYPAGKRVGWMPSPLHLLPYPS